MHGNMVYIERIPGTVVHEGWTHITVLPKNMQDKVKYYQ